MIYFTTDTENRVGYTHFRPFDEKYGLHKTADELRETGFLVEVMPTQFEGDVPEGKRPVLCYDNGFFWNFEDGEYEAPPPTYDELLEAYTILTGGEVNE